MRPEKVKVKVKQDQKLVVISRRVGEGIHIEGVGDVMVSNIAKGMTKEVTFLITIPKNQVVSRIKHESEEQCKGTR